MKNVLLLLSVLSISAAACGGPDDGATDVSEDAVTSGQPALSTYANWYGPLVVSGSGFNDEAEPVTIYVYSSSWALIASHTVRPARERCNVKGYCWGGGTFSSSFSVAEIGASRHAACETVYISACDPYFGCASSSAFLPSCIN